MRNKTNIRLTDDEFKKRLKIIGLLPLQKYPKNGFVKVKIKCFCEKIFKCRPHEIFSGDTRSCGCYRKSILEEKTKRYHDISISYFKKVIAGARERKIEFKITIEYAWRLFIKQKRKCIYSGRILQFSKNVNGRPKFQTASLDRIDPKKGYVKGNVQWVHKHINQMKWNMTENEFVLLCKEISNYFKDKR